MSVEASDNVAAINTMDGADVTDLVVIFRGAVPPAFESALFSSLQGSPFETECLSDRNGFFCKTVSVKMGPETQAALNHLSENVQREAGCRLSVLTGASDKPLYAPPGVPTFYCARNFLIVDARPEAGPA